MQSDLTVMAPAASQDLISLYTLRSELDIQTDVSDVKLSRWIGEASARIADFCGRSFRTETLAETFWSEIGAIEPCILTRVPVSSITSVTENGELLTADGWLLRGSRLWRVTGGSRLSWSGEIVVVYQAGYAAYADVPAVLQRACLSLIKDYWTAGQRDASLKRESLDIQGLETITNEYFASSVSMGGSMASDIKDMLMNYRDIMI